MQVGHTHLVVIVKIVRCGDDRHQTAEAVLTDPDDLFLSTDPTVVVSVATRPLADRETILQDPREMTRSDPQGPLSS